MAYAPVAPFTAPFSGSDDQKFAMVAEAISRKADATTQPTYSAVLLIAPNGSAWRLSVDNTGALSTAAVPRT
jgi:hypothetical protein